MSDQPERERFHARDLVPVRNSTPVEHFGGPDDGELRPLDENGARPGGMYVVMNEGDRTTGKRFVRSLMP